MYLYIAKLPIWRVNPSTLGQIDQSLFLRDHTYIAVDHHPAPLTIVPSFPPSFKMPTIDFGGLLASDAALTRFVVYPSIAYSLWSAYQTYLRYRARRKVRSEESRSPPRRGRKLERSLGLDVDIGGVKGRVTQENSSGSLFDDFKALNTTAGEKCQVKEDKRLYYMLQNLQDYPGELRFSCVKS